MTRSDWSAKFVKDTLKTPYKSVEGLVSLYVLFDPDPAVAVLPYLEAPLASTSIVGVTASS